MTPEEAHELAYQICTDMHIHQRVLYGHGDLICIARTIRRYFSEKETDLCQTTKSSGQTADTLEPPTTG